MAAEHGTRSRYNSGCRCEACVMASASTRVLSTCRERRAMKTGPIFIDDRGREVQAVTAEQHVLDHSGHVVVVKDAGSDGIYTMLQQICTDCDWWNEEGYK
jgi:hypothetical protein